MRRFLERNISTVAERLVILAPPKAPVPGVFARRRLDPARRIDLLHQAQRFRAEVYLRDGALRPEEIGPDGRHVTPEDDRSWHLLMLDEGQRVAATLWYLEHSPAISMKDLRVRNCPLAVDRAWRGRLRRSVAAEIGLAAREGIGYAEVGGWAARKQDQCSPEGLLLILATFGFSREFGGALGITTATVRHQSAAILRRLGLSGFPVGAVEAPTYFDPRYRCDMELLRFDTRSANRKYEAFVEMLRARMSDLRLLTATPVQVLAPETLGDTELVLPHRELIAPAAA